MTTRANAFPIRLAAILIALLTTWSWPGGAAEPQLSLAWIDGDGRTIARRILDRSELQALPQREIATATPWAPGVRRFRGPELGALAALVPGTPTEAQVAAHNDYTSVIPTADIAEYAPILQALLRESVLFNEQVAERERRLAESPATLPAVLAFGSAGLLVGLLMLQLRRERMARREIQIARESQRILEASLKRLIDAVPAGIALVEPAGRQVVFANPTAASLISADLQHPDWDTLIGLVLPSARADARHADGRTPVTLNSRDGRILSMTAVVREINWHGATVKLIAMANTTQLRDTELQLVHASKLASLGEMASAIGHELNQPLSVIKLAAGNAMRGLERGADRDATGAKLRRIIEQVDRARRITDQIRRYGTRPPGENRHFELRPAIDLAIGFVANQYRLAEIGLQTRFDLPVGVAVCGDQTMFEQVVVNLLVNAKDAFAEAHRAPSGPATVRVAARAEGQTITIDVADNAGGIPPKIVDRLFHPFATTKPAEKGTGLGLALARKVVADMGGTIVGGNADGGARFTITVPVHGVESRGCP